MTFASLGLAPDLVRAADALGALEPTPVQAAAIPAVLAGQDVRAAAATGSGKTLAYALPILQRVQVARRPWPRRVQALVLLPTRELALQVGDVFMQLARSIAGRHGDAPKVVIAHGGVSINPQMMALRGGAEIVVATPGRLLDLLDHHALRLHALTHLVLDEADRLLDLGFADEWARIRTLLPNHVPEPAADAAAAPATGASPPTRTQPRQGRAPVEPFRHVQHLFFSATFAPPVQALADALLREPLRVDLLGADAPPPPDITQRAIEVDVGRRTGLLRHLLNTEPEWTRVLVFVASRYATELVAHKLQRAGIAAAALHGELSQGARNAALNDFRDSRSRVLIATDVAARGLDIVDLPVVVNFDLPRSADDHVHRIGRTGRAGASGLAVSFVSAGTEGHFRLIEKRQDQRVAREQVAGYEPVEVATPEQATGGIKGHRPSKKDKLRAVAAAAVLEKASGRASAKG